MSVENPQRVRVLTWNLERQKPLSPKGELSASVLFDQSPDIMALTESRTGFDHRGGYQIWSERLPTPFGPDERKVGLWSRHTWKDIDIVGDKRLPKSRFVSGLTETPLGEVRVVGVCIPWHMADVQYGTADQKPWQRHIDYLLLLPDILSRYDEPVIIAGDFNQRIPRVAYGHKAAAVAIQKAFNDYTIVTSGTVEGTDKPGIDHIALSNDLNVSTVWRWSNAYDGVRLSDHDGAGCEVVDQRACAIGERQNFGPI